MSAGQRERTCSISYLLPRCSTNWRARQKTSAEAPCQPDLSCATPVGRVPTELLLWMCRPSRLTNVWGTLCVDRFAARWGGAGTRRVARQNTSAEPIRDSIPPVGRPAHGAWAKMRRCQSRCQCDLAAASVGDGGAYFVALLVYPCLRRVRQGSIWFRDPP